MLQNPKLVQKCHTHTPISLFSSNQKHKWQPIDIPLFHFNKAKIKTQLSNTIQTILSFFLWHSMTLTFFNSPPSTTLTRSFIGGSYQLKKQHAKDDPQLLQPKNILLGFRFDHEVLKSVGFPQWQNVICINWLPSIFLFLRKYYTNKSPKKQWLTSATTKKKKEKVIFWRWKICQGNW